MSIQLGQDIPVGKMHDHIRPNAANPLVRIKRDHAKEEENRQRELQEMLNNPRAIPSKGGKITDLNAPTPTKPSLPMPARFTQPQIWTNLSGPQHPLYRTASHTYGERPPAAEELQGVYYGNAHGFTSTFAGGMSRDFSLNTAITKSRVGAREEFGFN